MDVCLGLFSITVSNYHRLIKLKRTEKFKVKSHHLAIGDSLHYRSLYVEMTKLTFKIDPFSSPLRH